MGYASGMTGDRWSHIGLITVRGLGMALVAAVVSFAIATVGRHTAAALGALLGYVIVWEGGARIIMEIVSTNAVGQDPYFLSSYIMAWFAGEYRYYINYTYEGGGQIIYWWQAAVVFAVLAIGTAAVAFTGFRRRDLA
jgi:hypothetical protein